MADRKVRLLVEVTIPENAGGPPPAMIAGQLQALLASGEFHQRVSRFYDLADWWTSARVTVGAWTHHPGPEEWETAEPAGDWPDVDALRRKVDALGDEVWVKLHTATPGPRFVLDGRLRLIPLDDPETLPSGSEMELVWTRDGIRLDQVTPGGPEGDPEGWVEGPL